MPPCPQPMPTLAAGRPLALPPLPAVTLLMPARLGLHHAGAVFHSIASWGSAQQEVLETVQPTSAVVEEGQKHFG